MHAGAVKGNCGLWFVSSVHSCHQVVPQILSCSWPIHARLPYFMHMVAVRKAGAALVYSLAPISLGVLVLANFFLGHQRVSTQ